MADEQEAPVATTTESRSGMGGKMIIAGFMGGVIVIECLLAYLLIPSAEEVAALAEQNITKKLPANLGTDDPDVTEEQAKNAVEIDLGDYSMTVGQRNASTALRVDFHLVGIVLSADESNIRNLMERFPGRFREIVLQEIRSADREDFDDAELGLIKRRILEKSNTLFGKHILKSLIVDDFSYIEQ